MELPDEIKKRLEEVSVVEGSNVYKTEDLTKLESLIEDLRKDDLEFDFSTSAKYQKLIKERDTVISELKDKLIRAIEYLDFRLLEPERIILVDLQKVELDVLHPCIVDKNNVVWVYSAESMRYKPNQAHMTLELVKEYQDAGLF